MYINGVSQKSVNLLFQVFGSAGQVAQAQVRAGGNCVSQKSVNLLFQVFGSAGQVAQAQECRQRRGTRGQIGGERHPFSQVIESKESAQANSWCRLVARGRLFTLQAHTNA